MKDTWLTGGSNPFKASNNLGTDMITSADGHRNPSLINAKGNRINPYNVGGAVSGVVGNASLGSGSYGGSSGGSGGSGSGYSGYSYSSGPIGYNLDLSAFQKSRDAIIAGANNAKNMLKNQYDRLLAELDKKTKEGNEQFGRGRATISEDAYDRSRENLNSLAARGLAGSGLQQLGEVQERMETGQQMNDLASQYYAYLDDIDTQRKEGEAQYNEGIQSIEDSLQQQLANIGLQEFQAQDDYNRYMSNLAMQLAEVQGYNAGRSIVQGNADSKLALAEANLLGKGQAFDNGLYGTDYDAYYSDVRDALYDYIAAGGQDATKYAQMLALTLPDDSTNTNNSGNTQGSSGTYDFSLVNLTGNPKNTSPVTYNPFSTSNKGNLKVGSYSGLLY